MKKIVYLCLIALAVIACKKEEAEQPATPAEPVTSYVTNNPYNASITGTCVSGGAPQWVKVGNLGLSQMQVMVDQYGVPTTLQQNDQLAAFVGEECRGVTTAFMDGENKWRFNLTVHTTASDTDLSKLQFSLRYYSTKEPGTYTSDPIQYQDNVILGSNTDGFVPTWK